MQWLEKSIIAKTRLIREDSPTTTVSVLSAVNILIRGRFKTLMVTCPKCGLKFKFSARAKIGEGTRLTRQKETLNQNQIAIGQILSESDRLLTVRQIQGILYKKGKKRRQRREKIPSGQWNYHQVQVECSVLLGLKLATMTRTKEFTDEHGFGAQPIPHYYMTTEQKEKFAEILAKQGKIKISTMLGETCPACGYPV